MSVYVSDEPLGDLVTMALLAPTIVPGMIAGTAAIVGVGSMAAKAMKDKGGSPAQVEAARQSAEIKAAKEIKKKEEELASIRKGNFWIAGGIAVALGVGLVIFLKK